MKLVKPSLVSVFVVSLLGCSTAPDTENGNQEKLYTQTEMNLMLAKAKSEERARIEKELNRQQKQKDLFNQIREHQQNLQKNKETAKSTQKLNKNSEKKSGSVSSEKIIPTSRKPVLYKEIKGVKYYRCAANSLVAVSYKNNYWHYDPSSKELSATLCKKSRDLVTIKKLQQALYDQGLLKSDSLTKEQLVDGIWGESTLQAVKKYQQKNGLLLGQLTIQTLEHLGVFSTNTVNTDSMQGLNIIKPSVEIADVEEDSNQDNSATIDTQKTQVAVETLSVESQSPTTSVTAESKKVVKAPAVESKSQSSDISDKENLVKVIEKIIPKNRSQQLYKTVSGADYYRCAANSLVPQKNDFGDWAYSSDKQELSATLCKRSRDVATMTDLQYILNEKGYLTSRNLTKGQLISGNWDQATLAAVKKYQRENGLLYGQLTIETLEYLGVFKPDAKRIKWVSSNTKNTEKPVELDKTNKIKNIIVAPGQVTEVKGQDNKQTLANDKSIEFNAIEVIKPTEDAINYALFKPETAKPVLYAKQVNGKALWRCRAHAFMASKDSNGLISYDENKEYKATLCKMSRSKAIIKQLQLALKQKGYLKPSPPLDLVVIDGIWGINTLSALKAYQRANGLAYGQLTIDSLEKLGVFKAH
ncbi:hypothetical protein JCM30760_14670 [Thiomicrorhabdus hydrogeniphila]